MYSKEFIQDDVNTIADWAEANGTPLSIEKCCVLHCGSNQPFNEYHIKGCPIKSINSFTDLGIKRSVDSTYAEHCHDVVVKATKVCGIIRHVFHYRHQKLLLSAFVHYVLPTLSYCSPIWSPYLKRDINVLENVQRRFAKRISGFKSLPYDERLLTLNALSLSDRRLYTDMVTVFKFLHGQVNCSATDVGLVLTTSLTRGNGSRLFQRRPANRTCANLFSFRSASEWNKLPAAVINCTSLRLFKLAMYKYLIHKANFSF